MKNFSDRQIELLIQERFPFRAGKITGRWNENGTFLVSHSETLIAVDDPYQKSPWFNRDHELSDTARKYRDLASKAWGYPG